MSATSITCANSLISGPFVGSVVDLFCGAGGLAHGFFNEGFRVEAGVDLDPACKYPFERNNRSTFHQIDMTEADAATIAALMPETGPRILVGCAPCQPFSTYTQKRMDFQYGLVPKFAEIICEVKPDVVSMENVPALVDYHNGRLLADFIERLEAAEYHVSKQIVYLPDYGLAQKRKRLVVLASRLGQILLEPPPTPVQPETVQDVIGNLPPLRAGEVDPADALHCASRVSDLNLRRLQASKPGGTWRDWNAELVAKCHRESTGKGYGAVYGRMRWDEPAPTMTTLFYGFGNGRFGHPEQDRALSLREGALLQTFPPDYQFAEPGKKPNMRTTGRLIGNAVPVALGRIIARSVRRHLSLHPTR